MTIAVRGSSIKDNEKEKELGQTRSSPQIFQLSQNDLISSKADMEENIHGVHDINFPIQHLNKLDEMISRPRWIVPVLPDGELEVLLESAIAYCKLGLDSNNESCQKFYREGLIVSFTKILTDEAVNGWKYEIHKCIMKNCERLIELSVLKLPHDCFPILELLAMVFNPNNKFHIFNGSRQSETVPLGSSLLDDQIFARPIDTRTPRGWLVDLINKFGQLGGFQSLLQRFEMGENLYIALIFALLRPFANCCDFLTSYTIQKYFAPIVDMVPNFVDNLSDSDLKKESKIESKNDALSCFIKFLKEFAARMQNSEDKIKQLEIFRLKMILRLLQISSFNGKMNALNELNKIISSINFYSHRHNTLDEEEWLTAERIADWIKENKVLQIVLKDSLHQPQYVEKLEKMIRFVIKEKALAMEDLDNIWAAQSGKHEAIVKNVHDLLTKLAWDFSPEQLDHLFECFQASWTQANRRQREKLLELIQRLAEDDKEGIMAGKVLMLLWNLAHSDDVPTEIMEQSLLALIRILENSCCQDRDAQKMQWLNKCIDELKRNNWVIPALKLIQDICMQYSVAPQQKLSQMSRGLHMMYSFIALKDGHMWLCDPQAKEIWKCLTERAVCAKDREICFQWYSKLMGEEPDLDPVIYKDFFVNNILQLDPTLLTENGLKCFEKFFKSVNTKEKKLISKRKKYLMNDYDLIGMDYLWKIMLCSEAEVSGKAIVFLKEIYTNLGPHLFANQKELHEDFISNCIDRLKASYDTLTILKKDEKSTSQFRHELNRICRILKIMFEYIEECDNVYGDERANLPLRRACFGKQMPLCIRFPNQGRQLEDMEIWTHSNESLGTIRRQILQRISPAGSSMKVELFCNGEILDASEDKKLISELPQLNDRIISAKFSHLISNVSSSPDSSSDSSPGSPQHPFVNISLHAESSLPGMYLSQKPQYVQFLIQLADLGCSLQHTVLRDYSFGLLRLIPADFNQSEIIKNICLEPMTSDEAISSHLEKLFSSNSPSLVLYNLEILYTLLLPAQNRLSDKTFEVQLNFIKKGGIEIILGMFKKGSFQSLTSHSLRRSIFLVLLKLIKFLLTTIAHSILQVCQEGHSVSWFTQVPFTSLIQGNGKMNSSAFQGQINVLQQALQHIPNQVTEMMLRSAAARLSHHVNLTESQYIPDMCIVKTIIKLAWSSASCNSQFLDLSDEEYHHLMGNVDKINNLEIDDVNVCQESLEILSIIFTLNPLLLELLIKDKNFQHFVIDFLLLLNCRSIRITAAEQFSLIATKCSTSSQPLQFFLSVLFKVLNSCVQDLASHSNEYFQLLCHLLNCAFMSNMNINISVDTLLRNEINWLKKVQMQTNEIDDNLLEGHLSITKELLLFQTSDMKFSIGSNPEKGINLLKELLENFLCPASKMLVQYRKSRELPKEQANPVCCSPATISAAYDLIVALCTNCPQNLNFVSQSLYQDEEIIEWEFLPSIGPRPVKGFVGLKNAGATCYMNSVLQQLYMIEPIRKGILSVEGAATDLDEDFSGEEKLIKEPIAENYCTDTEIQIDREDTRREYNIGILKQVQAIFGYLASSKLQYYVPRGLWRHFRLMGEPVNLREQHDALEFFNSLVDSIDEALKSLCCEQIMTKILGGSFADQKICKGCPHRYSREESFTVLNIDIRNQNNLLDSLEQYVKGDLLEGANAYHCDKCDRKVDTVKRMCIKKLPPILAIQLKRFDYDWERESAVKFNDYFEFPRELDLEPYTAKIEGEIIEDDLDFSSGEICSRYKLTGIVVHSGQASGGHYYSYILHRYADGSKRWYKFDDGDVIECKMEDDEEMKNQCFGGEYIGEQVFDHISKRMNPRRQKRWWNAYILFYARLDVEESIMLPSLDNLTLSDNQHSVIKMPVAIERSVLKQNIRFLHLFNQFSPEYFYFMKKLIACNAAAVAAASSHDKMSGDMIELAMTSIHLVSKFLFRIGFHTKKSLRGPAADWNEAIYIYLKSSRNVRSWFAHNIILNHPQRMCKYILECTSSEVRSAFVKIVAYLAHFLLQDGNNPVPVPPGSSFPSLDNGITLSDYLLQSVLALLKKEVTDNYRHLPQYFCLFLIYLSMGQQEKNQLLRLGVPSIFISVAIDEGPGPPIKYQFVDLGKLHQVVSQLVRCCDINSKAQNQQMLQPLPNPYGDSNGYIMPIPQDLYELLFRRMSYLKKVIEYANTSDDTVKLLKFCCWENPQCSGAILNDLLWQIAYPYSCELRPYLEILLNLLTMEDSWQSHRIHNALKGNSEDRLGLFDTIQKNKNVNHKRAYQCFKCLVNLFSSCPSANQLLQVNGELKHKFSMALDWLHDELDKPQYASNVPYGYSSWSPPTQSNETSNSFHLERSHSASMILQQAYSLCPEEELEGEDISEDEVISTEEQKMSLPYTSMQYSPYVTPYSRYMMTGAQECKSPPGNVSSQNHILPCDDSLSESHIQDDA